MSAQPGVLVYSGKVLVHEECGSAMPHPKDVFNNPVKYWDFLTASDDARFEGQHFDRKEAGRVGSHGHVSKGDLSQLTEDIRECISAFANINRDGGLVVVGITQEGEVKGTKHLTDEQRNQITNFNNLLCHQAAQVSTHGCSSDQSDEDEIYLIYVPYTDRAICETPGPSPKAWIRQGSQNLPITESMRDTLRREKRIVDYEQSYCCAYDATDLDQSVLREFRSVHLEHANYDYSDEDVLYHAGALERNADEFSWKHSGLLFFSSNPQRVIPA
ncbi:MAG: ATP-binding protein, partial [Chloroflexi bacterium]|nr:ATP-binding protein [Chloroflexota bacterium]